MLQIQHLLLHLLIGQAQLLAVELSPTLPPSLTHRHLTLTTSLSQLQVNNFLLQPLILSI